MGRKAKLHLQPFLCTALTALLFAGCSAAPFQQFHDSLLSSVPVYRTSYSFAASALEEKNDQLRNYYSASFTYADAEIDAKIAGERQGDEVSLYLTTAPLGITQTEWYQSRPAGVYPPIHIASFDSSASGLSSNAFKQKIFYNPRTEELDHGFFAAHGVARRYVMSHCKLIVSYINDVLPLPFAFDTKAHEDLYMQRAWGPAVTLIASFKYGNTDKRERGYSRGKLPNEFFEVPYVEDLRGTEREPNVLVIFPHYKDLYGSVLPGAFAPKMDTWIRHYRCSPEQIKEARREFLEDNEQARAEYQRLIEKHGFDASVL